ncbi:MAG: helix-turn-helix domain-containing protein [Butyricimonas paravirosa]
MLTKIEQYVIDRVRDRRNQLGLTQDDLAIKSGYSSGFIATVEAGKKEKKYNLNNLLAFAKAMKCSQVFLPKIFLILIN